MGISFKLFTVVLLLVTLCYGKDQHKIGKENVLDVKNTTENGETPILQHGYYDNTAPRGVIIVTPIVSLLLIGCCVYFCCRCRSQRNMGVVVNTQMAAPHPTTQTIIFQQQAPAHVQPQQPPPAAYPQQHVPPPTHYPQQHVPPPYDTQPYPQQQFHQQAPPPTAFENPNYAPQSPVNMQYGQEKY